MRQEPPNRMSRNLDVGNIIDTDADVTAFKVCVLVAELKGDTARFQLNGRQRVEVESSF